MLTQSNRHLRVNNNTHTKQTNKHKSRQNKRRQTEAQCTELHKRRKIKIRKKETRHCSEYIYGTGDTFWCRKSWSSWYKILARKGSCSLSRSA